MQQHCVICRDSTIVQPTGCEKSLYYQLVSLQSKKMVFVFTHMVALMYDQIRHLQNGGIPAIALGADYHRLQLLATQSPGEPMVVYLTAEYMMVPLESAVQGLGCCSSASWLRKAEIH